MSNFNVTRLGDRHPAGGDARELFLSLFSGEVLQAYLTSTIMAGLTRNRNVSGQKSAIFPLIGTTTASRHTPGNELLGNTVKHTDRVINVDDLLVAHTSVANIDEAMNYFDVRQDYVRKMAHALANTDDKNRLQVVCLAARAAATLPDYSGGSELTDEANAGTDAAKLLKQIAVAAQKLDEKSVPSEDRSCVLKPAQWYLLTQNGQAFHRDYGNDGNGSQKSGVIGEWHGVRLYKSNNVPSTDLSGASTTGEFNTYKADFSKTICPVFHRAAIGTVTLLAMATEMEYSVSRQATLLVSKIANGHGILQPECAVEIRSGV